MLELLGAHHILHFSRIRVNVLMAYKFGDPQLSGALRASSGLLWNSFNFYTVYSYLCQLIGILQFHVFVQDKVCQSEVHFVIQFQRSLVSQKIVVPYLR